jgi:hypothetical protein
VLARFLKIVKRMDEYGAMLICANCGAENGAIIKKGVLISGAIFKNNRCLYCGCDTLKKDEQ